MLKKVSYALVAFSPLAAVAQAIDTAPIIAAGDNASLAISAITAVLVGIWAGKLIYRKLFGG